MWRREKLSEIRNCKVIKGESAQHKVVVADLQFESRKKGKQRRIEQKVKSWRLNVAKLKLEFKDKVLETRTPWEKVQEWWDNKSAGIGATGEELLGKPSGR